MQGGNPAQTKQESCLQSESTLEGGVFRSGEDNQGSPLETDHPTKYPAHRIEKGRAKKRFGILNFENGGLRVVTRDQIRPDETRPDETRPSP